MNEDDESKKVQGETSENLTTDNTLNDEIVKDNAIDIDLEVIEVDTLANKDEELSVEEAKATEVDNNQEDNTQENNGEENSSDSETKKSEKSEKSEKKEKAKKNKVKPEFKLDKNFIIRETFNWIVTIIACIVIAKMINTLIIVNARVPSASMETTIMTNDRLVANRLAYIFDEPEKDDIIVFKAPDDPEKPYIKRVIGTPGDRVDILDGVLYINGELVEEPYIKEEMVGSFGPYYVPEDSYFVLGDNRNNSLDARFWANTYVPKDTIYGKAIFTYYPSVHVVR